MPAQCSHEGCTEDATFLTQIRSPGPAPLPAPEVRCGLHKYTRPDDTVAIAQPLPAEE